MADVARWCLCDSERAPVKLSPCHKAALWALHFGLAGSLEMEILSDDFKDAPPPDVAPLVSASTSRALPLAPREPASIDTASAAKRTLLREAAALLKVQGGDLSRVGLDVLPDADPLLVGKRMRSSTRDFEFLRMLPAAGAPAAAVASHVNRKRRLILEAWQEWGAAGGLSPLGISDRVFVGPGGARLNTPYNADWENEREFLAVLPFVVVRACVGLADPDDKLMLGNLSEMDQNRLRALHLEAQRANAAFEASWEVDKACTARAVATVLLLSTSGSFFCDDVPPEVEIAGNNARLDAESGEEPDSIEAEHERAANWRARLIACAQTTTPEGAVERPVWECNDGDGDRCYHPDDGPMAIDRASFAACGEVLRIPLKWNCAPDISLAKQVRMMGEYHAAMANAHGLAGLEALQRAYDSPNLRMTAIRSIAHPSAHVWLDFMSPAQDRAKYQQFHENELLTCDGCFEVRDASALFTCTGCRIARYCGPACQKKAWPLHKRGCSGANHGA
jgi:hypothetical protein